MDLATVREKIDLQDWQRGMEGLRKVRTLTQCGKISVQALCRVPLTSRIRQSIVGSHSTATVGPSFLAAVAAAGFLHFTEQLPVT
jgi:hypothetical protein